MPAVEEIVTTWPAGFCRSAVWGLVLGVVGADGRVLGLNGLFVGFTSRAALIGIANSPASAVGGPGPVWLAEEGTRDEVRGCEVFDRCPSGGWGARNLAR
jgi:hypothetical protein